MKIPEKLTKTEGILLAMTCLFLLCTGILFTLRAEAQEKADYCIAQELKEEEEKEAEEIDLEEAAVPMAPTPEEPLEVNSATAEELDGLPGIGPVLSERIVEYREKNGPFTGKTELMEVSGIGEGIYGKIEDYIVIKEAAS